jgi:hypothetical protein
MQSEIHHPNMFFTIATLPGRITLPSRLLQHLPLLDKSVNSLTIDDVVPNFSTSITCVLEIVLVRSGRMNCWSESLPLLQSCYHCLHKFVEHHSQILSFHYSGYNMLVDLVEPSLPVVEAEKQVADMKSLVGSSMSVAC